MKIFFKLLLAAFLFISMDRLIRTQTHGFRFEKIQSDYSFRFDWEPSPFSLDLCSDFCNLIDQPFYFLGSGVQCYAFLSKDQTTVLKVFKHYHLGLSSKILQKLPLPKPLKNWRDHLLQKRKNRMESIFSSALLAYRELSDKTGLVYLNINPQDHRYPCVVIYDNIGIRYRLDLNKTPFLLQKKADPIFSYLNENIGNTKEIIDSFFACLSNRTKREIFNTDPRIYRNFGISNKEVIEIDIGSFTKNLSIDSSFLRKNLLNESQEFKEWVKKNTPELSNYFDQKLLEYHELIPKS